MPRKKRRWLIDAFNLMHQLPEIKPKLDGQHIAAMQEFCQLMAATCRRHAREARLIFDGIDQRLTGSYSRVEYSYGNGRPADDLIIEMMQHPEAAQNWLVITDDREIRARAFYYKVDIIRCGDFIENYLEPPEASPVAGERPSRVTAPPAEDPGGKEDPDISDEEFHTMMRLFNSQK